MTGLEHFLSLFEAVSDLQFLLCDLYVTLVHLPIHVYSLLWVFICY